MKLLYKVVTIAAFGAPLTLAPSLFAQDSSGDFMLNGPGYRFRYVAPVNYNNNGNVSEVVAAEGQIIFNGTGTYTIAAGSQYIDSGANSGKPQEFPTGAGGTYAIGANGLGYISNPLGSINAYGELASIAELGSYASGIFSGSATESFVESQQEFAINDLLVVMAVGAAPTNATFGKYWLGLLDFSGGTDLLLKNGIVETTPNGSGGFGALSVSGVTNNQTSLLTQTVNGATYSFAADGGVNMTFPLPSGVATANALLTGTRLMYVSADGNFALGWNPSGWDIIVGVKAPSVTPADSLVSGSYYTGGLSDIPQQCGAESYWGLTYSDGMEDEIVHQRFFSQACSPLETSVPSGYATDFGTDDYQTSAINSDGSVADTNGNYYGFGDYQATCATAAGTGPCANAFVSVSNAPGFFSLAIGVHAPGFSGGGVYIDPARVYNAASFQPITAAIAPMELVTLFGSGLYAGPGSSQCPGCAIITGGQPAPTSLGNVQVLVNGQPAPVFFVSPTQVSFIVPYATSSATSAYATLQINNNGQLSNVVTLFLTDANPGLFTFGQNGIGDAIVEHANGTLVSPASPAAPGEVVVLALTGLGTVSPFPGDGAIGPPYPGLSYANNYNDGPCTSTRSTFACLSVFFTDYINQVYGQESTLSYGGLYPGFAGLYQMNVQIPTNVGPGDVYIEVVTDSADNEQVTVCVTGSCGVSDPGIDASLSQLRQTQVPTEQALKHQKTMLQAKKLREAAQIARPPLRPLRTVVPAPASPQN